MQFLRPWEYLHPSQPLPDKILEISWGKNFKEEINNQAPIAKAIIEKHLEFSIKAREEQKNIMEILTPEGLDGFFKMFQAKEKKMEGTSSL
jgi:hypothetical protein